MTSFGPLSGGLDRQFYLTFLSQYNSINMKIQDVVIKEKCIVLGVFGTDTFEYFKGIKKVMSWGDFPSLPMDEEWEKAGGYILSKVLYVAKQTDQIIFVLDDIHFPINTDRSMTCSELEMICKRPELFNKTVFVKGKNVIEFDKNLVLN